MTQEAVMTFYSQAEAATCLIRQGLVQDEQQKGYLRLVTEGEPAMAKYQVIITQDEDGMYLAECHAIPGCVSEGATVEQALANIREAIQGCLETRRALGMPLTLDVHEVEV